MSDILEIRNLSYKYTGNNSAHAIDALKDVSFKLESDSSIALIGANGAGKSTLLLLILGILQPDAGEIIFDGNLLTKKTIRGIREKIGLIFQNADNQLFCNTVYEDVALGLLNMGVPEKEADARVMATLNNLGISHLADRPPYRLSGGEKRLSAIAGVLAMNPTALLMDEPTAELDPRARRNLINLLNHIKQPKIIATHDLDFAKKTCAKTLILHNGKIATKGSTKDILQNEDLLQEHGL